jgi:ubiquitin C-terminal hydrolase
MVAIPPLGFANFNSICYFNALMQCLLSSQIFQRCAKESGDLLFNNFFDNIKEGKWDNFFTTRFLESIPGGNLPNQSSSEYLLLLIEALKIDQLFEYQHLVRRTCLGCGVISEVMDKSTDLLLHNNMTEFFEYSEVINGVACDKCCLTKEQRVDIKQERLLRSIPPLIVISLNKYFEKTKFYYPPYFKIDVPSGRASEQHKMTEETNVIEYTLVATLDHFGSLGGGHYVSRVLRTDQDGQKKGFLINDSSTQPSELNCVDNSYMLFYERKI